MRENHHTKVYILHLILKYKWYDLIKSGKKKIEYRDHTRYWVNRIWGKDFVTFHRGYTSETMTFRIKYVNWGRKTIEIHLGEGIDV